MTDDFELTRRKTLAALGTIGVASAGAGLGTSAYFSDQETFENNQLTAGTLDMKVAATEYYSDWSPDEAELAEMAADADSTDIRLPPGDDQGDARAIALDLDDDYDGTGDVYGAFFETISTDVDGTPYNQVNGGVSAANDGGLCGTGSDADGPMIIGIEDVKPGDFGGAQFAFELCDNPGYVWLTGGLRDASENGVTEPEADDPDEEEGVVELLDEIQVAYGVGPIDGDTTAFEDTDAGFQPTTQQSLREFLATIDADGLALDGDIDAEVGGGTGEQGCFAGGNPEEPSVHEVSVVWWLPINHGNQVQSDSATFDLGFYTEQCRHNDGETDLVAYYPFENSADDVSGNGYDGTLENGVSFTSGQVGRAAEFDGDGDYIEISPNYQFADDQAFSITGWFNRDAVSGFNDRLLGFDTVNSWGLLFDGGYVDGGDDLVFRYGATNLASGVETTFGTWTQFAVTHDGSGGLTFYIDGSEEATASGASWPMPTQSFIIGNTKRWTDRNDEWFDGAIDDVRIYARALSASEVQSLYDSA